MTKRTSADICLLCNIRPAIVKGSHFTDAGIMSKVIGKRDAEKLFSIYSDQAKIDVYHGRDNLENTDTEIKVRPHVADYIFCRECEDYFSKIEGACNHSLNTFVTALIKHDVTFGRTSLRKKFFEFDKPNKNLVILYFYTVIWRQCLEQQIEYGTIILGVQDQEDLRAIIYSEIQKSLKEISESKNFLNYPKLVIFTSFHYRKAVTNFINPHTKYTNPHLFFVGPYDCLYFIPNKPFSADLTAKTAVPATLVDDALAINNYEKSLIALVDEKQWMKIVKKLAEIEAKTYNLAKLGWK